jgi:hypothetical protein
MGPYLVLFDRQTYTTRVAPALEAYAASGDPGLILPLLEQANRQAANSESLRERLLTHEIDLLQTTMRILTGEGSPAVANELVAALCVPDLPGITAEVSIADNPLTAYLFRYSAWIENAFTAGLFGRGEPLRFPLGMQSEIVSADDTRQLLQEMKHLSPPASLFESFINMKRMADTALADPNLALVVTFQ